MSQEEIDILKRALSRERASRKAAEEILEAKSAELYELNKKLEASHKELSTLYSKTNSQLQGVFENIADAYVIADVNGDIIKMNEATLSLLGIQNINDSCNLMELVKPSEYDRVYKAFNMLYKEGGNISDLRVNITTVDKRDILVQINASVIYDKEQPIATQGIVRDITLDNKYKLAIEAEKQKYSSIIANMHLGLVELDIEERIVMVNQSYINMSGYSEEELLGKVGKDVLLAKADRDMVEERMHDRKKGLTNAYEIRVKNKQGELRHWLVSGAPNYNFNGEIIGSIGIVYDITEIKQLHLQKENLLLKLEKSNDELQEYAHIVSHDLKSPLRSINALVTWLKQDNEDKLDDSSLKNIALIETTLEKMEHLISDVLNYSSVGADNDVSEKVNTNDLVEELLKILFIPDHIKVKIIKPLPIVTGDKTKLQQMFQNLISNAVKFNDKEQGIIEIDVEASTNSYLFSIKDNGIGIEPQFHEKIFKIFHSLNRSKDSTGIGLSLVKKIVNLHDGKIWLESEPGKGTTFYFTIKR